ncbi:HTH domain-containing protein, partial [Streptococcus canis]|uniref:HTH domain-containing protein n=1 Tax=Streptococcus canis TaxID=1329 RepID=UPI002F964BEA
MLNQRRQQLLSLLQTADDFQTLDYLASQCGVSKRTIHSDLDALEEALEIEGSIIERKRGVGVYLKKKTKETIVSLDSTASESYDIVTRRISIMQSLLFEHQSVSYNTLSNIYYVSKSSIIKDLSHIEKILGRDNRLKLESDKKGTRFVGKEIDYQNAHLQFNKYIFANSRIILDESNSHKIELLFPYYGTEIVKVCQNTFYSYIRENINVISDHYV